MLIPITGPRMSPVSLFFVTTSAFGQWVICVPAAFLRSGSRLSGSLSGIEPQFPVTRQHHCGRLCHSRQLIGHTLDGRVAGIKPCDPQKVIQSHQGSRPRGPFGFDLIKAPLPQGRGHSARISSRITAVIRVTVTVQYIRCDLMSHSRFRRTRACT